MSSIAITRIRMAGIHQLNVNRIHSQEGLLINAAESILQGTFTATCSVINFRFPFNTEGGSRGCCNGHTFNTANLECCGSTLVASGSCPATTTQPPPDPCSPDPCQNGVCMNTEADTGIAGSFVCLCDPNWSGQFCHIPIVSFV